jgi:hypothetical protein
MKDICSIRRRCCNVATYKWKVHNRKTKITHLVVTLHSQPEFTVMKVVLSIHSRNNRTEVVLYKSPEHITLQVMLGIKVQQTLQPKWNFV